MKKTNHSVDNELVFVVLAFVIWRVALIIVSLFVSRFFELQPNFLGGGRSAYLENPVFWSMANFDGQHYLNISQNGYGLGEYAFFPLYPLIIKYMGMLFGGSLELLNFYGQIISNAAALLGVVGFYRLARMDLSKESSRLALILLLVFPASFYFAAVYTESLFFALLVWAFYYARIRKFRTASIIGFFLAVTRPVGIFLFPAMWLEAYYGKNLRLDSTASQINTRGFPTKFIRDVMSSFPPASLLIPAGLGIYMLYLKNRVNDSLAFFHQIAVYGEQRSTTLVLLPQVLYRYVFKILPNLNFNYFPGIFFTLLEFGISLLYLPAIIMLLFKSRPSYFAFSILAYLLPTLTGSFSSMPRYLLVLFPIYIFLAERLIRSKIMVFAFCFISSILLVISLSLFERGYWIS